MEVKLSWSDVKYLDDDLTKLDVINAPCAPPLEGMVFKGYTGSADGQTPYAFSREGLKERGPDFHGAAEAAAISETVPIPAVRALVSERFASLVRARDAE